MMNKDPKHAMTPGSSLMTTSQFFTQRCIDNKKSGLTSDLRERPDDAHESMATAGETADSSERRHQGQMVGTLICSSVKGQPHYSS